MKAPQRSISTKAILGWTALALSTAVLLMTLGYLAYRDGVSLRLAAFGAAVGALVATVGWALAVQLVTIIDDEGVSQPKLLRGRVTLRWADISAVTFFLDRMTAQVVSVRLHSTAGTADVNLSYWERTSLMNSLRAFLPTHVESFRKMEKYF